MKVLILANANSIHTERWVLSLAKFKIEIGVFTLQKTLTEIYVGIPNVHVFCNDSRNNSNISGDVSKLAIIQFLPKLYLVIKQFEPDILHAHFASSYGLLGALSGFKPYILSVWGSDIFIFPKHSVLHKYLIKFNLKKADLILSTSNIMKQEILKYTHNNVKVLPFGVDLSLFKKKKISNVFSSENIVIGTVKSLSKIYGIEFLIKAFTVAKSNLNDIPMKLLIVGSGEDDKLLKGLCEELSIQDDVLFTGSVQHNDVPEYLNNMDVYVALSISESFGVSIIEASACEIPVIVSNVGGLIEVVDDKNTGYIVESQNIIEASQAIVRLILDQNMRIKMGKAGRQRVKQLYDWETNVAEMVRIYQGFLINNLKNNISNFDI